jgi:hypothetical protein
MSEIVKTPYCEKVCRDLQVRDRNQCLQNFRLFAASCMPFVFMHAIFSPTGSLMQTVESL